MTYLDVFDLPHVVRGVVDVRAEVAPEIRSSVPCPRHYEEVIIY